MPYIYKGKLKNCIGGVAMMKKKGLTICMIIVFALSVLVGCGDSQTDNSTNTGNTSTNTNSTGDNTSAISEKEIEIEFVQVKREAVESFDKVIQGFYETHSDSNIIIKQNPVPDAQEVLMTRASSGNLPDMMTHWPTDAQYVQFADKGLIMDLKDKDYVENIIDTYVEGTMRNDGLYILPLSLNFMGVFYNEDKFNEAGFEIPTTWDELIDVSQQIKDKGEIAFLLPNKDAWTISQLWGNIEGKDIGAHQELYAKMNAGETSFAEEPVYKSSLEKMVQLLDYAQPDSLAVGYDQAINDFANGGSYMFLQGSWALPAIKAANPDVNVGMFPTPNDNGDMKQPVGGDCGFCVNSEIADDPEKMAAIDEFLGYMFSKDGAQIFADSDNSLSCVEGVTANIPELQTIIDYIDAHGVMDNGILPIGFEDTKRGKIQNVLMGQDIDEFLVELSNDYNAALGN